MATLPLVTMTSEMKQCTGRWKLTEKRILIWDYLEKFGASGKRSAKSAQGELLFWGPLDGSRKKATGNAVDYTANQILKMARFGPSRARLHAPFSRGWRVRCCINYSVHDCSLSRLQSFDQRRWSKGSRRGAKDSKGRV